MEGGGDDAGGLPVVRICAPCVEAAADALDLERRLREARLGVACGSRVIAIDIAEIALAIDQRIADGEVLGQTGQGIVDGLVAMRMQIAHRLADNLGALAVRRLRIEVQPTHGKQDASVNGLQPVAHIRQSTAHDGGQRISKIALFQRLS